MSLMRLRPFWRYYGGKYRAAPRYPPPVHGTIIEPFAGSAGYSLRYYDRQIILVESYPVVAGIWRYLIGASSEEIRRIPEVENIDDLPPWVPQEARWLVGFCLNAACVAPCRVLSSGRKKLRAMGRKYEGWSPAHRESVAHQVEYIRHWCVVEGDYTWSPIEPDVTYFVDPPYNNKAGSYYVHSAIDYEALGGWCRALTGQVIVCENEGANWLPFRPFTTLKAGVNGKGSKEVIWIDSHTAQSWGEL